MKAKIAVLAFPALLAAAGATGLERPQQGASTRAHEPPPQAYADCGGKRATPLRSRKEKRLFQQCRNSLRLELPPT